MTAARRYSCAWSRPVPIDRELAFAGPREAQFRRVYAFPWFKRPLLSCDVYRLSGSLQVEPRRREVSDPHGKPYWPVTLRNATKYTASGNTVLSACSSTTESIGTGTCVARVTTRLCWRAATGHTVMATNSATSNVHRTAGIVIASAPNRVMRL